MAIQFQGLSGTVAEVDTYLRSQRVAAVPRGANYAISSVTGTIAAALGVSSSVFIMRCSPTTGRVVYITKVRVRWVTIAAFTTAITAGRRLAFYRGSGAAASGGTALAAGAKKNTADIVSACDSANGGDMRIATTAALTVTGITFETQEIRTMALTGHGAAGANVEDVYEFDAQGGAPIYLRPGELFAIRNPAAMDAGGTWQIDVDIDWYEL